MPYIDKNTYEIYDDIEEDYLSDDFFYVDEMIALVVAEFNKKGYKTLYSCAGHIHKSLMKAYSQNKSKEITIEVKSEFYISFQCKYNFESLVPKGFYIENCKDRTILRKEYIEDTDTIARGIEIIETMAILLNWLKDGESCD